MEGVYKFCWAAFNKNHGIEGVYEQAIYAEDLMSATAYFTDHHGELAPDGNGVYLVITSVSWEPA